jgi:hypothetical protein
VAICLAYYAITCATETLLTNKSLAGTHLKSLKTFPKLQKWSPDVILSIVVDLEHAMLMFFYLIKVF